MTMAWTPPSIFRSCAPTEVWNALLSRCGESAPLAGKNVFAAFEPASAPASSSISALIQAGDSRAVIVFNSFPFAALFGSDVAVEDFERLPPALRDVLIEGMLTSLWNVIPQNGLPRFSILRIGSCGETLQEIDALYWLAVAIRGLAPQPAQLLVGCSPIAAVRAIVGGDLASRAVWTGLRERLTAEVFPTLGDIQLPKDRLSMLAPGAVVVLPDMANGVRLMRLDRDVHEFRTGEEGWTYFGSHGLGRMRREAQLTRGDEMSDEPAVEDVVDDHPSLPTLMLQIDFELGGVRVPLSTVETWRAGALVELDPPTLNEGLEVTLRANGQGIAVGDLIRIDERFAVRLSRLLIGP
jgi:flagellar motor switch/type III secretory pathway protein FliN